MTPRLAGDPVTCDPDESSGRPIAYPWGHK
jgi:hypothetical protein